MLRYTIRRVLTMIPILICIIAIVFTICYFMPGDPVKVLLRSDYTQEQYDAKKAEMGLDQPFIVQLGKYYLGLIKGDLGNSYITERPVVVELQGRIWTTLKLGLLSCLLTIVFAIPVGLVTAVKQNSFLDYVISIMAIGLASVPGFWLAMMGVLIFAVKLNWLPATGLASAKAYILPVVCNALPGIATTIRITRSSMLEVLKADYIKTSRAKGMTERVTIWKHALNNALIPVIAVVGGQLSTILAGSVIVETIFNIPGMGSKLVTAIAGRDRMLILGITILMSAFIMVIMLIVDLVYAVVDPRIKAEFEARYRKRKRGVVRNGS